MNESDNKLSRRELFRSAGRWAVLAGLAGAVATLWRRDKLALPGQSCANQGICRDCRALPDCGLPAALSLKRAQEAGRG